MRLLPYSTVLDVEKVRPRPHLLAKRDGGAARLPNLKSWRFGNLDYPPPPASAMNGRPEALNVR